MKNSDNNSEKISIPVKSGDILRSEIKDLSKRTFLKALGGAGVGALLLTFLRANKTDALVMGGTPSATVVGLKNSSNNRINPATAENQDILHNDIAKIFATKITISGANTYVAKALIGSAQGSANWQVKKITVSGSDTIITWADGNANFDNVATDLTLLNYS